MSLFVRPPPSIGADDFEEEVLGKLRVGPPTCRWRRPRRCCSLKSFDPTRSASFSLPVSTLVQFVTMDAYFNAMDALGNKIVAFVDPQNEFTGYTEVRERMNPAFSHIIIGPRPNNEA